jgi:hypothetical protein
VLFFGVFPIVTGCASSVSPADMQKRQQALATSDHLIVPGERIGPIRLGMSTQEVLATLGPPDEKKDLIKADNGTVLTVEWDYWSLNLPLWFDANTPTPYIEQASTLNWQGERPVVTMFQTREGLQIGRSAFDVKNAYGDPSSQVGAANYYWGNMSYHKLGMQFMLHRSNLDADLQVSGIGIHRRHN